MSAKQLDQFFNKPGCWQSELILLRSILKKTALTEAFKWYQTCYTWEDKNVAIVSSFKDYCIIGFFKGALLKDYSGLLTHSGKYTQLGRQMRFIGYEEIKEKEKEILVYLNEAIEIEKSGQKPVMKTTEQYEIVEEWRLTLKNNPK